nr:hypothetical protein [uncultured Neisseria sp.]
MKIMSYIITHDYGFAPNPYGGFLTLATCKPKIRNSAKIGDILVGIGSSTGAYKNRLLYVAQVSDVVNMNEYFENPIYQVKKPSDENISRRRGDNIYYQENGTWIQLNNPFHDEGNMSHDLNSTNVLICEDFWYFGSKAPLLPEKFLGIVKKGPGHKNINDQNLVSSFLDWLSIHEKGLIGKPSSLGNR